jgi:hypothetical protein
MADGRAAIAEEFRNIGRRLALGPLISKVEEADAKGDVGMPVNAAYTPRWMFCQRPKRT